MGRGWGRGGADEEWEVRKGAVFSKVLGQFYVESNILFSANFMKPNYQIEFEEMTCCLSWCLFFEFRTNLKVTNKKLVFFFYILSHPIPNFNRFHCVS